MIDLSIVIPVKDEEENIFELIERILKTINKLNLDYEIIFITDINKDKTFELLKTLNKKDDRIKTIKLSNKFGHHIAVLVGLRYSKGNAVVVMDGDLQDYPEDIVKLYDKFKEGYDVVYGIKEIKNESKWRNFLSKTFLKLLNLLSDYDLSYNTSMFRIISRRTAEEVLRFNEIDPSLTAIISLIGFPTAKVLVNSGKRKFGKTKYDIFRQINFALSFLFSFSIKPLRISSILGLIIFILSFIYLLIVVVQKIFFNIAVLGWPTIVSLITFLGGIQLLFFGVLGEYVGRIFLEAKKRPLYIVDEKVGNFN